MRDWVGKPNALNPRDHFPRLAPLFDHAEALALAVCWGTFSSVEALDLLRFSRLARFAPAEHQSAIRMRLSWCLNDAIEQTARARMHAYEAAQRALAPLLDARASDAELRAVVIEHGQCLFAPRELRELIRTEAAWWVRLHAVLADNDDQQASDPDCEAAHA